MTVMCATIRAMNHTPCNAMKIRRPPGGGGQKAMLKAEMVLLMLLMLLMLLKRKSENSPELRNWLETCWLHLPSPQLLPNRYEWDILNLITASSWH